MTALPYLVNRLPTHAQPLDPYDAEMLNREAVQRVAKILALRANRAETPLHNLAALATHLGIGSLSVKDEGLRLGLGSFKALGGAYALMVLVQEEASRRLGRAIAVEELMSDTVRAIASTMTFACATDGNHGRSVAQGAQWLGARAVIFVHAGVSQARIAAIAGFGAEIVQVKGGYDFSVQEAARVAHESAWTLLSDTSWEGYEYIPSLVSQGYIVMVQEILAKLPEPPTHVFLQAGVGSFAAAVAGHLALVLGEQRPQVTIVEPERAACLYASAQQGLPVKLEASQATIMAMLECHEPSRLAFRILARVADGFMTVDEASAPEIMQRLASPLAGDPPIVAGESGGVGLAGLIAVLRDAKLATELGLDQQARVLVINTEGATDPALYTQIVGRSPEAVLQGVRV